MISLATPTPVQSHSSSIQDSPTSARSRRIAILQPPPPPPPEPESPTLPSRSPLRPTPRASEFTPAPDPALSKRKHALFELLTSERAYASDLALIRDIHIPLALGLPVPFPTPNIPRLSSPNSPMGPPMTKEDTKLIFGNVEELAVFSEVFCDKLEDALRGVLDLDGDGQDHVGELFLSMIPHLKPPYMTYITRHPSALAHLNALPQTPALTTYLAETHTLAQSYTHAWDLPSLLIKPVQRLLKYPLLLTAIIEDTEPGEARDRLQEARDKVEEVARGVNENRRRLEVVKGVLDGKHPPPVRLKSIRNFKLRNGGKDDHDQLERLEKRLHECETFVREFAKNIVDWTMSLRDTITQLERWSTTFGCVIGLGHPHGSEALELFTEIVSSQITPVWISLDEAIHATFLPKLSRLRDTTAQPLLLLSHVRALRPQHLQLLDLPISKARPPTALMDASQSYLALDAQLRAELPRYIELLERGYVTCLRQFADWQARFWREVRAQWVELWDALGVEGDMTAGAAETVKIWRERWEEVDATVASLQIIKMRHDRNSRTSAQSQHTASQPTINHTSTSTTSTVTSIDKPPSVSIPAPPPGPTAALATAFVGGLSPSSPKQSSPKQPISSPLSSVHSPAPSTKNRLNSLDIDYFETEMHAFGLRSPEATSPQSPAMSSYKLTKPRKDRERSSAPRRTNDRQPTSSSTRQESTHRGVLKKASVDSGGSMLSSPQSYTQPSPSSRTSVHTSGSSLSQSESRSSSNNNRLSVHSEDHTSDMPGALPPSRTSQTASRKNGTAPAVSLSDLFNSLNAPVLPETSSMASSKKKKASTVDEDETRGRSAKKPTMRKRFAEAFRSSSKGPPPSRGPISIQDISHPIPLAAASPTTQAEPEWEEVPLPEVAMYVCTAVHPFALPGKTPQMYRGLPFLSLVVGDNLEILSEEGHPRTHEELPIRSEDEDCDDCLLLARHQNGKVGWALASFLVLLS